MSALGSLGKRLRAWPRLPLAVGIGWAFYLPSQAYIAHTLGESRAKMVAMQTSLTHQGLADTLATFTEADFANYAAHAHWDIVHVFIYSITLCWSLAWGFRATGVSRRWDGILWLPFVAGAMDQLENFASHVVISSLPDIPFWAFACAATGSVIKWSIGLPGLFSLPVFVAIATVQRHGKRSPST